MLAISAVTYLGSALQLQAAGRVALVIGNGQYQNTTSLATPANDATDMADLLDRLGFSVIKVLNANYSEFRKAIRSFNAQVQDADIGLVYYAGHGMELGGENWLIPVDADLKTDLDLASEALGLKTVMQSVSRVRELGLVILDSCRDNPFAAKMLRSKLTRSVDRGLVRVEPGTNVLVAYAAKDGTTAADGQGRNSPYTAALLKELATPGLEISFVFRKVRDDVMAATAKRQQPFVYGSLSSKAIYFSPASPASRPPAPQPAAARPADETVWLAIRESSDPQLLESFLSKFPGSSHEADARLRLEELKVAGECDRLTASVMGQATARSVTVIDGGDLDVDPALRACDAALEHFPRVPRYAFEAGRAAEAKQEYARARDWLDRAVALDDVPAMVDLAMLWEAGRGGAKDYGKARELYEKAAARGDRTAMTRLGAMYEAGRGVPQSYGDTHRWYRKAADAGDPEAMARLAKLYEQGRGVRRSAATARAWRERAENLKQHSAAAAPGAVQPPP